MITSPTSTVANAAAAAATLARSAPATAPSPGAIRARRGSRSTPARAPARALATARRAAPARKARIRASSAAGYAAATAPASSTKASSASSSSAASGPLAFLKDPKLSIEEKLMKLLGYLNTKWEKEMQQKLDTIAGGDGGKKAASASGSSPAGSKKKSGGLLDSFGGIGKFVQSVVAPAKAVLEFPLVRDVLKQVGGPALAAGATALGFPELAPVLLKYGPELVDRASSLVASLDGDSGAGRAASTASSSSARASRAAFTASSGGSGAVSDAERQTLVLEIQRLQQKQQEMFGLVSNILRSNHDTRLAMVNNIR